MRLCFRGSEDLDIIAGKPASLIIEHSIPPAGLKLVEHFDNSIFLERKSRCMGACVLIIKAPHPYTCSLINETFIWLAEHEVTGILDSKLD